MSIAPNPTPPKALPWPAISLLPHRPPMLFVEALTAREGSCSRARARLPEAGLLVEEGRVAPEYFVELVAQTAALGNGYDRALAGCAPGSGMIVGVDGFCWPTAATAQQGMVEIRTEVTMVFAAMKVVRGEVYQGSDLLASGEVRVWEDGELSLPAAEAEDGGSMVLKEVQNQGLAAVLADCCCRWREEDGDGQRAAFGEYCFPADFPGFAGHFPGSPLLPGVLQLAAARHGASRLLGYSPVLSTLDKIKFKGMILPGDQVFLALDFKDLDGEVRVKFSWKRPDGSAISSGILCFS